MTLLQKPVLRSVRPAASAFRLLAATFNTSSPCPPPLGTVVRRNFGASPRRDKFSGRVTFDPTGNPELDKKLQEILHTIILPAHLNEAQRKRVFDKNKAEELRKNPIVIEVDGIEYKFPTLDFSRGDVQPSRHALYDTLHTMRTARDWAQLPTLMAGMQAAGRKWVPGAVPKVIRIAGQMNQIYAIIECARQVERTGLALDTPERAVMTIFWLGMQAVETGDGWEPEPTNKAVRWAQMVEDIVQEDLHRQRGPPMHHNPVFQLMILFLAAGRAVNLQGGRDLDGAVALRAARVARGWPAGKGMFDMAPDSAYAHGETGLAFLRKIRATALSISSMAVKALRMAREVLLQPPPPPPPPPGDQEGEGEGEVEVEMTAAAAAVKAASLTTATDPAAALDVPAILLDIETKVTAEMEQMLEEDLPATRGRYTHARLILGSKDKWDGLTGTKWEKLQGEGWPKKRAELLRKAEENEALAV